MRASLAVFEKVRFEFAREVLCACCQAPLERHQPDGDRPEQLLGTCYDCGSWFLIDGEECVMIVLPDIRTLRAS